MMKRLPVVLSVLALGTSGAVLACEYESPASRAMLNATPVPKVAFKQAAKPAVAPVAKQAATPAATTPGKKSVVLASMKAPMPKD
jgi:hypothetical protein